MCEDALGGQKKVLYFLELELQMLMSPTAWVRRTGLWPSERTVSATLSGPSPAFLHYVLSEHINIAWNLLF